MKHMYKQKFARKALLSLCCVLSVSTLTAQEKAFQNGIRQGRVIVKFKENPTIVKSIQRSAGKQKRAGEVQSFQDIPQLDQLSRLLLVNEVSPLFVSNPKFQKRFEKEGLDRWFVLDYDAAQSPFAAMNTLKGIAEIEIAEPEFELIQPTYSIKEVEIPSVVSKSSQPVDDPLFPKQWHYHNVGQTGGKKGADINLVEAWKKRMSANPVIVAIMDQGVDTSHEDIRDNMWVNEAELYGTPGVDDDGNGIIDDVYGYDFGNGYGSIEKGEHGTHVAGTVAAVNNNGKGVAGVAGGSGKGDGAKMMSLPVFGADQNRAANAFIYAADNGALISQNSWGYNAPGVTSVAFEEGIKYFTKYAGCDNEGNQLPGSLMKGGLVIFASGNMTQDGLWYPACMEEVLAVSSLNHMNGPAFYSNYDTWVDVSSYGGETSRLLEQGVLSTVPGNKYGYMQGTSMACPHVSGIAALALAELGGSGFSNEMLRNYLTLTTRPNEENYSTMYSGKMGSGISDALKSMTKNDGIPPKQVTDLVLKMYSDDYMQISFSAPSKEDGSRVEGYKVILTDSLKNIREEVITKVNNPGEQELIMIRDLVKNMPYSVSVVSYDIWGTTSMPSQIVEFTTASHKGNLTYSKPAFTSIRKKADYANEQYWEFDIELFNNSKDELAGGLFWRADSYEHNHVNNVPVWAKSVSEILDETPQIQVLSKIIETSGNTNARGNVYEEAGYKKWIVNRPKLEADAFIGEVKENGKMFSSSAAQKFIVPSVYDTGFSLSHFDMSLRTSDFWLYDNQVNAPEKLNIRIEIFKGGDQPRIENRIFSGNVVDMPQKTITILKLPYSHYFESGESFWIVLHADSRYRYPLGVNGEGARPENALYSSDEGKTWKVLSSVYPKLQNPVFTISALSDGRRGRAPIELTPASGYLAKGGKTTVKARMKFKDIAEGIDSSYVTFYTDGTIQNGRQLLTAILDLKRDEIGAQFSTDLYEFGMISQGDMQTKRVLLYNRGMGHLAIDSIRLSNNKLFRIIGETPSMIYSGDSAFIDVELKPAEIGAHNTQLHVYGRGKTYTTFLIGTCVEAPSAELTPGSFHIDVQGNQDMINKTLTLKNTSNYSLRFALPLFLSDKSASRKPEQQLVPSVERTDTLDLIAGYKWMDNNMGRGYEGSPWIDISKTGIELTNKCDALKKFTKVRLPFNFRFYDKTVKDVFVGINGTLRLDSATVSSDVPVVLPYDGVYEEMYGKYDGLIAPLWFLDGSEGHFQNVKFYYQVMEDCALFQYSGIQVKYAGAADMRFSMQVALYPDGSFEFRYNDPFQMNIIANTFLIGWSSPNGKDGKTIYYEERNIENEMRQGYCIKVIPPIIAPFTANPSFTYSGIVKPLSSIEIPLRIKASDVSSGNSVHTLNVETNDPENKQIGVDFTFTKKDAMNVEFMEDQVNYGQFIFGKSKIYKNVALFNNSESEEAVVVKLKSGDQVVFENGSSSITRTMKPKRVLIIPVELKGAFDSELIVESQDGSLVYDQLRIKASELNYQNYTASILDKKELSFDLDAGAVKSEIIKVSADGNAYSSKFFVPGYIDVEKLESNSSARTKSADTKIDFSGFRWYSSHDSNAPQYIWTDISKTGTRVPLSPDTEYEGNPIPFDFPFYGNKYSKIYISANGRISPFPLGWDIMYDYVPPRRMPDGSIPNPLISAMWNRQWYSFDNKDAGIFIEANEDKVIIQYHQFQYDWVITNGVTSYQIILYKDGTVQFVYKDIEQCDLKNCVTIGMQGVGLSDNETDGFTYTLNSSTPIKNKTTITAKPMYGPYRVEAGEKIDLKFTANSYGYKAGEYKDSIILISENNQEMIKIPVAMKVGSNANLVTKENEVNFGEVITGQFVDMQVVNVMNSGNQDIVISGLKFEGEDKSIFELKRRVVSTENANVIISYEPIELPLTLGAYGMETYYAFMTPENVTKQCLANLVFTTSANTLSVPFKANVLKPSALEVTTTDGNKQLTLDLSNVSGPVTQGLKLNYTDGVNPIDFELMTRVLNTPVTKAKRVAAQNVNQLPFGTVVIDKTELPENTILNMKPMSISSEKIEPFGSVSIIGDNPPQAMIGTSSVGAYYGLSCMVKMNTGDKGFLMSHVRMLTNTLGRDTSHVEIRVYNDCKEPSAEHLIYEKAYKLRMNVPLVGEVYLPLEESLAFAPNQDFWVEVYFGVNLQMPMAVAPIPEGGYTDRNKYRLFDGRSETWTGIYDYPAYFAIWAVQESYSDLTKWIELTSEKPTISPKESVNGKAQINYLHFPLSEMNLEVTAKTNKLSTVEPLLVNAKKYDAINWIQFPEEALIVREGESISFNINAIDPAGSEVNYQLSSPVDGVTIEKQTDGSAKVTYKASYLSAFVTNLNIEARTESALSVKRISIANANVNRAPKSLPVEPITLNLNSLNSLVLPPSYFFNDPDGDAMQFRGSISSSGLGISLSEKGFVFTPIHEDVVDVVIVATDGEFEVTNKFRVNVVNLLNTPPVLVKTFGNKRVETGKSYSMSLSSYFIDQEGDAITFDAWATDGDIADVEVNGDMMNLYVKNPGQTAIAVKAVDSNMGETLTTFIILAQGSSMGDAAQNKITISPNPTNSVSRISVEVENEQEPVYYEVTNLSGKLIVTDVMSTENGLSAATIHVSGLTPGMYIVKVRQGSKVISLEKLIVTK